MSRLMTLKLPRPAWRESTPTVNCVAVLDVGDPVLFRGPLLRVRRAAKMPQVDVWGSRWLDRLVTTRQWLRARGR